MAQFIANAVQAGNPDQCARLKLKARPAVHCASISTAVPVFHFLLASCSLQTSAADPFTPSVDKIRYLLHAAACSMHLSIGRCLFARRFSYTCTVCFGGRLLKVVLNHIGKITVNISNYSNSCSLWTTNTPKTLDLFSFCIIVCIVLS